MISVVTKNIKGKEYLYLVESIRKEQKVIQKTIKYIGPKRPITKAEFECMVNSYNKTDWLLNEYNNQLSYKHHQEMKQASENYKKYLDSLDQISKEKEKERFLSQLISSSNAIENSTLTFKETYDYFFNDVAPKGHTKKELHMAANLLEAWDYLEKNASRFPTTEDLCKLHGFVNRHIESEETLGRYKHVQNYIGDIYTTSYLFAEERMEKLLSWIKTAFKRIDNFEAAFQSHAQFEVIHPFIDGNGRIGRLLMNWLLVYKGLMPLVIRSNKKEEYFLALENFRRGKIEAISLFCYQEYMGQYETI